MKSDTLIVASLAIGGSLHIQQALNLRSRPTGCLKGGLGGRSRRFRMIAFALSGLSSNPEVLWHSMNAFSALQSSCHHQRAADRVVRDGAWLHQLHQLTPSQHADLTHAPRTGPIIHQSCSGARQRTAEQASPCAAVHLPDMQSLSATYSVVPCTEEASRRVVRSIPEDRLCCCKRPAQRYTRVR